MKCPACDNELTEVTIGKVTVDVCHGGCGGIWFDNFELKRVDVEREGELLLHVERDDHQLVDYERRRHCPRCTQVVMMRHYFSERRQVEIDTCPNCGGVWLDAGELAVIRQECSNKEDRQAAAQKYFSQVFNQDFLRRRGPRQAGSP
jgi:Zn-finger nucleic acid-binding protein